MTTVSIARAGFVKRSLPALAAAFAVLLAGAARAEWKYERDEGHARGTLTVSKRGAVEFVTARQFCFALGCRIFYQWPSQRAFINNPSTNRGAIVSPLADFALVDGQLVDFDGSLAEDDSEGYLLPIGLAVPLARDLHLGRVYEATSVATVADQRRFTRELRTLVIDPGHGGNDLGTKLGDLYEKDIAVLYAMKLRDELKKQLPELKVILTREDDRYISLPDRAKLANSENASLFLSLHVNHASDAKVEGIETYILSPDATDDEARKLALLENDTWLKSAKIGEAGNDVRKILIDMEQEKYIQDSALAASMIAQEMKPLDARRGLKNRGVKQAMFYVLSQVAMPSTLVEMGFLSNPGDRGRMMNVEFRDDFVQALVTALKRYSEPTRGATKAQASN